MTGGPVSRNHSAVSLYGVLMPARWIDAGYRSVLASRSNCPLLCFVLLLEQASSCRNVCECTDGGMSLPPEALMPSSLSNPLAILRSFRMLLSVIRTHGEYLRVPALPLPPFPTAFPVWLCSYCVSISLKSGRSNSNYLCLSRCRYACRITPCVRACVGATLKFDRNVSCHGKIWSSNWLIDDILAERLVRNLLQTKCK